MILHSVVTAHKSRSESFYLVPIGDIHLGSKGCHVRRLKEVIEWVRQEPNAYAVGMGDYIEAIKPQDKRFDSKSVDPRYLQDLENATDLAVEDLGEMLHPIRHKLVGLLTGNHEEKVRLRDRDDPQRRLCRALRVKDLGYDALIRWTFRRGGGSKEPAKTIFVAASHGTIAGRSLSGCVGRMERVGSQVEADLYLFGHGHQLIWFQTTRVSGNDSGELHLGERLKSFAMTGTFRKTYEEGTRDYGEKAHYPAALLGSPKLTVRPWARPERLVSWDVL